MKNILLVTVLFQLFLISSCMDKETIENELKMEVDTTSLQFKYSKFNVAIKKAKDENKYLLVYVTGDGCGPCLRMERDVFSDSIVCEVFNKNFICSKIHIKRTGPVMEWREYDGLNKTQIDFLNFHNVQLAFPTFLIF